MKFETVKKTGRRSIREPHVMMPYAKNGGHPNRILAVDTETHPDEDNPEIQRLTLGWYMGEDILAKRQRKHCEGEFTSTDEFWDLAESMTTRHKELTIVALNMGGFDSKVMEAESQMGKRGWLVTKFIVPKPFMVHFRKQDGVTPAGNPRWRRIALIDLSNFYPNMSVAKIGRQLGLPKGEPAGGPAHPRYYPSNGCVPGTPVWRVLSRYCRRDTEIVLRGIEKYVNFCLENELGPWRETISGQALTAWVQMTLHPIVPLMHIHDNEPVTQLERDAYHGAVTDVWRIGRYSEPGGYYYHDVNSLYPSVMRENEYPVKLLGFRQGTGIATTRFERVERITGILKHGGGVVARVLLDTSRSDADPQELRLFPVVQDKLVFPVGRVEAALTSRELQQAIDLGILYDVKQMAIYQMEPIFVKYVDKFFGLKDKYRKEDNDVFYLITKLFLNGLYGKWAQHNPEWEPTEMELPEGFNVMTFVTSKNEDVTLRTYANYTEKTTGKLVEAYNAFAGLAAHITADARMKLFGFRKQAGVKHCYYGDTDSLLTDAVGHSNLEAAGALDDYKLGMLKTEAGPLEEINIVAPKTYKIAGKPWVRKGVRRDANELWVVDSHGIIEASGRVFWQIQFEGFAGAMQRGRPNEARIRTVKKSMTNVYNKGIIEPDGWISPFNLEMW